MPVLKGALVKLDAGLLGALPDIVVFQFNPETMTRTPALAQPPGAAGGAGAKDVQQQVAEPTESISFTLRLDATDQLAARDPVAVASGVLPTLSALELLMHPTPRPQNALLRRLAPLGGSTSVDSYYSPPQQLPTVLFFWGVSRLLPVTVTSLSITEMQYDPFLTPVRAEVSVTLEVSTPHQLSPDSKLARGAYRYSQKAKEVLAAANVYASGSEVLKAVSAI